MASILSRPQRVVQTEYELVHCDLLETQGQYLRLFHSPDYAKPGVECWNSLPVPQVVIPSLRTNGW